MVAVFTSRFGVTGVRLTGGEPTVRAHLPVLVGQLARLPGAAGPGHHHQRRHAAPAGRRSARRPGSTGSTSAATPSGRDRVRRDHPARLAPGRARRHRGGEGGRVRAGEGQLRPHARRQRRRDRRLRPIRSRRMASACASSSSCRSTPRAGGSATRSCPARRCSSGSAAVFPIEAGRSRSRAGVPASATATGRGVRRHRQRHPALLRHVRPGADHRRRAVPDLPVRPRRDRSAGQFSATAAPTTTWRPRSAPRWQASGPATRSATVTFIRPPRSMSQIGG